MLISNSIEKYVNREKTVCIKAKTVWESLEDSDGMGAVKFPIPI